MFARNLTSLVVLLILANPVVCQMFGVGGGAPSDDCEDPCASSICDGDAGCCQRDRCKGPRQKREAPSEPCNCPGGAYCQCLAAGAVIKEAGSRDDAREGFALDRITAVLTIARPTVCSVPDGFGERSPRGKANPGRIARCLCMSFLC